MSKFCINQKVRVVTHGGCDDAFGKETHITAIRGGLKGAIFGGADGKVYDVAITCPHCNNDLHYPAEDLRPILTEGEDKFMEQVKSTLPIKELEPA